MMPRVYIGRIPQGRMEQAAFLDIYMVDGIGPVGFLAVADVSTGAVSLKILINRTAKGNIEDLDAAANAKMGFPAS